MTTQQSQWLFFKDAVAAVDAAGLQLGTGGTERRLRYMWQYRNELDCGRCFRKLGGKLLVNIDELRVWRDGAPSAGEGELA